jgi:hypothetical protein
MRAFQVHLNGKKLCVAGIGDDGVLTTIVSYAARQGVADVFLQVGGLQTSPTKEHVRWVNQKPLSVGDEIRIQFVEASSVDAPTDSYEKHPAETLKAKERYVLEAAKELGWTINKP